MQEKFDGDNSARVKAAILKQQKQPALATLYLKEALEDLEKAEAKIDEEKSKRWKAHFYYVLARLKSRLIYVIEYNYALGQIRRDDLPILEGGAKGYILGSRDRPSANEAEVRAWSRELRRLWRKIITDYPNTPWSMMARRERNSALGLEWRLAR